jgi:hypothetical protein
LGDKEFQGSVGWLAVFRKRHQVTFRSLSGESAPVSEDMMSEWLPERLPQLLQDCTPQNVFNADEAGLFWRLLPDKPLHSRVINVMEVRK